MIQTKERPELHMISAFKEKPEASVTRQHVGPGDYEGTRDLGGDQRSGP